MIQVQIFSEEEIKKIAEIQALVVGESIEEVLKEFQQNHAAQIQQLKQEFYEVSTRLDRFLEKR